MVHMTIQIPDPITVKELAEALGQRPFRLVADWMKLGQMKFEGDQVEFDMASRIAQKYGFETKRKG